MNYEESMAGLDQVFKALLSDQQRPVITEVDEMQQNKQSVQDMLVEAIMPTQFDSGISTMNQMRQQASSGKKKNPDYQFDPFR